MDVDDDSCKAYNSIAAGLDEDPFAGYHGKARSN